ncbi:hypothetical protein [Paenibacillus sp. LjRoot153]|uniref:hypothetical protein n=1 Tax=Paenibacillus sp. LjRoot153 TaxID=3342270 RepID=UPI003F4FCE64
MCVYQNADSDARESQGRLMCSEFILSLEVAYYGVRESGTAIEELGSTTTRR